MIWFICVDLEFDSILEHRIDIYPSSLELENLEFLSSFFCIISWRTMKNNGGFKFTIAILAQNGCMREAEPKSCEQ